MRADEVHDHVEPGRAQAMQCRALGREHQGFGRVGDIVAAFRQAISLAPESAKAHYDLGNALLIAGQVEEAVNCLQRAIELKPDCAEAHDCLGRGLWQQGHFDTAVEHFRRAVQLKPGVAALHCNLGGALYQQGEHDEGIECYRRAVARDPNSAAAFSNLGNALQETRQLDEAVACCRRAIEIRPDFAGAHVNLGNALRNLGQTDRNITIEAVECYRRALHAEPNYAEAHNNLGIALLDLGDQGEAIECFRRGLGLKPSYYEAHCNLAKAFRDLGDLEQAAECYKRALQLKPDWAEAHSGLADTLMGLGDLAQAAACYQRALQIKPDLAEAHLGHGMLLLRQGDLRNGWREYQWRWKTGQSAFIDRGFQQPEWDGRELSGETILIYAEQGLGDTIQFARYAPLVKARGARVLVQCQIGLTRLLSSAEGIDQVITWGESLPPFDERVAMMSLPRIFDTSLETIPAKENYLSADPALVAKWRPALSSDNRFKVGIAWQCNPGNDSAPRRSFPVTHFLALAGVPDVALYSLQKGPATAELEKLHDVLSVIDLTGEITDFADAAAIISQLDLVITCDTSVAHLAGALGIPTWVALPYSAPWRWFCEREDSPWYPTMRLFRQQRAGDWDEVFARMAAALSQLVDGRSLVRDTHQDSRPIPVHHPEDTDTADQTVPAPKQGSAEAHYNQGIALAAQGKADEAAACYRRALELRPNFAAALHNLGNGLQKQGKFDEAMVCYRRALQLEPENAVVYYCLGNALALQEQRNLEEAVACYRSALEIKPDFAKAHQNLGSALTMQGKLDEAIACYGRALQLSPEYADAHWNRSCLYLLQGKFEQGWPEYEWRWRTKMPQFVNRDFQQPRWGGKPIEGKTIVLHAEQGFGDAIQFIRYARHVKSLGSTVILECQPELIRLLRLCSGIDAICGRGEVLPSFDAHVPLLSLPAIFGTTLESIPAEVPYLKSDCSLMEDSRNKLLGGGDFKIGITWRGNPSHAGDRFRSFPLSCFSALARVRGVRLYSLQKGSVSAELKAYGDQMRVTDLGEQIADFADTAAIMSQLDLVISCDSAPAHLAGALGRPVWVALPFAPDWRWLLDRDDSPWYPSMRLFRQRRAGEWGEVFEQIAQALQEFVNGGQPSSRHTGAEEHYKLGNALAAQEKFDEAEACYRRALDLKSEFVSAHHNLGSALTKQGKFDEAVACYRRALELKPDYAAAHYNLGTVLERQGKLDEAMACYRRALELKPDYAEAHNNLGIALKEQGELDEAVACCRRALELKPDYAEAHNNLGIALQGQGKLDEAMACYRRTLELRPDYAEAHNNLGVTLQERGITDEALACYDRALRLVPDHAAANWNQSLLQLLRGDFKRGWPGYEWRWRTKAKQFVSRGFQQPLWYGQSFEEKTVLLHAEQGFGDTIQFIRYAHQVKARGGTVVVECQPELIRLLRSCSGIDAILGRGQLLPSFDAHVPLLSLPGVFDTDLETIPAEIPYLNADCNLVEQWRSKLPNGGDFKIGIIWQGNLASAQLRSRSFPITQFRSFARLPNVSLYSLQKGAASADLKACGDGLPVTDLSEQITDFADTAAIMSQLDLIITCDSSPAHLAGALGRPVWVALKFAADWRWLLEREDTPWYPTMRLFRQQNAGDWDEVFQRILRALEELLGGASGHDGGPAHQPTPMPDLQRAKTTGPNALAPRSAKTADVEVDAAASYRLGNSLASQGKLDEAVSCYRCAIQAQPDLAEAHHNLGSALTKQGNLDEAIACYRRAIKLKTDYTRAYHNLGIVLQQQGKIDEAIDCYHRALKLKPDFVEAHRDLSDALTKQGKFDVAADSLRRVVELSPNDAGAHSKLAYALRKLERFTDAEQCCRTALELRPDDSGAHYELAEALWDHGKVAEAAVCFRQALDLAPNSAEAHFNLASALLALNQLDEAEACYERALKINEDLAMARLGWGYVRLRRGDWLSGWRDYEWRWKTNLPVFAQGKFDGPAWDGSRLGGKTILLYSEQGLGDTIQFVRYASILKQQGAQVWLRCQPELLKLLNGARGIDRLFSVGEPLPSVDERVALMSLPNLMGTTVETVPSETPYLDVNPDRVEKWRAIMRADEAIGRFKIGIVWQSNPANLRARGRSFPIEQFQTISQWSDVLLYSLQKGPAGAALRAGGACLPVTDLSEQLNDFADTAAIMSHLDLVISCDTAVAHLAGALGRPVWVALPFAPDWRWLLDRDDSPWYPTMRLFRQREPGNWDEVFARIASALLEVGYRRLPER